MKRWRTNFHWPLCAILIGIPYNALASDPDAYKPINEIRSMQSFVTGARTQSRAEADRFHRALTELTLVRPYPLKLDDGVVIWRIERSDGDTFHVRLSDTPCLDWQKLINRFNAKYVVNPHWYLYEAKGRYFIGSFTIRHGCANKFEIKMR